MPKSAKKSTSPKTDNQGKRPEGRPPIWTSPEALQHIIDEYFKREQKPTFAGLAVAMGIGRSTLYEYEAKDEFSDTIKAARHRMMEIYEQHLMYSGNATGVIFALKNFGWADSQKVDHSTLGKPLSIGVVSYEPNNA